MFQYMALLTVATPPLTWMPQLFGVLILFSLTMLLVLGAVTSIHQPQVLMVLRVTMLFVPWTRMPVLGGAIPVIVLFMIRQFAEGS